MSEILIQEAPAVATAAEPIRIHGEREAFERSFVAKNLYPEAQLPAGFERFTAMQEAARERSHDRESYVLAAPTSSGKTIAFAAPIFERGRRAVFVYPFRALLLDQASELLRVARWFGYGPEDFGYLMGGVSREEVSAEVSNRRFLLATPDKLVSLFFATERDQLDTMNVLSSSDFVFDEVHAYSPMMTRSLVYFIRSVRLWHERRSRGRARAVERPSFVFASATLPGALLAELETSLSVGAASALTGPSNTGDVDLEILAPRQIKRGEHPVAHDMMERDALAHAMVVMNDPFSAYAVCRTGALARSALLFVGQDKQSEVERRRHLQLFATEPERHVLVGSTAIEAGVDLSARHLFMESGFGDSTVQRFGRAARGGHDARVTIYGSLLCQRLREGALETAYSRSDFNALLGRMHPARPTARLMSGLAAGPYIEFWGAEARHIIEPEDLAFHQEVTGRGAPALMAFRSLSPYTSYESGERIGFSALLRKSLATVDGKVTGTPSVDRYFAADRRAAATVDIRTIAHMEAGTVEKEGRLWPVHHLLAEADFGPFGRHWSVFEIGPGGESPPDNMVLYYRGRAISGPEAMGADGSPRMARFYA